MLRAVIRPPDDPAKRAEVARLREDVAKVSALVAAGRCDQAAKLGQPIRQNAVRLGYRPLEAEITYALGRRVDTCFDLQQALSDLEDAVMAAQASRHEEIAIDASAWLGGAYADRVHDAKMGRHWIRLGEAILARFPGHPGLEARIVTSRGMLFSAEGRFEEAVRDERRAIAIQESLSEPSSLDVAMSANNAAIFLHELGRDAEALPLIRRSLAIFGDKLGEDNGHFAVGSLNESEILTGLGQFASARSAIEKARAIFKREDPGPFGIGYMLLDEGKLELAEGNPRAAVTSLEKSLSFLGTQDRRWTAEARFTLARALWQSAPLKRKQALELARAASDATADAPTAVGLKRAIAAWQREHAAGRPRDGGG